MSKVVMSNEDKQKVLDRIERLATDQNFANEFCHTEEGDVTLASGIVVERSKLLVRNLVSAGSDEITVYPEEDGSMHLTGFFPSIKESQNGEAADLVDVWCLPNGNVQLAGDNIFVSQRVLSRIQNVCRMESTEHFEIAMSPNTAEGFNNPS